MYLRVLAVHVDIYLIYHDFAYNLNATSITYSFESQLT